ncbi:MAG: hypothetical protein GY772_17725, partial [bacterium]|nr:hypothetical protein [bacterium]
MSGPTDWASVGASTARPLDLFVCPQPAPETVRGAYLFNCFPTGMLLMAKEALLPWALRDLASDSTLAALNWELIQEELLGSSEELWAHEEEGQLGAPDTDDAVVALTQAGFSLNMVLAGTTQHFGGRILDCCVVAAAIRMRITPRVRFYAPVHNRVYAQIAAGTHEPDGTRVELSSKSQEKLGNVF